MLRKLSAILLIATLGAMALAQNGVQGASGKGAAQDARGRIGEFDFEVVKRTMGDRTELGGRFVFQTLGVVDGHHVRITIRLHELTGLVTNRDHRTAQIAGNGVMIIRRGDRSEEIRGSIRATFADRRSREHPDAPHDLISVGFSQGTRGMFGFEGGVIRGDIRVFWRML
ncbi:MAG: hypothetical protein WAO58_10045 [Fimbriimonadaceae bacterium]